MVAMVNGRAVFASCVRIQAEAHAISRESALGECIDFELLAQAAEAAETATHPTITHPDVQRVAKQELVRAFVEDRYNVRGPDDLPIDLVKRLWEQVQVPRYNHPELRNIVFCRVPLTAAQGPASDEYKVGLAFLQSVYEKLRDVRDIKKNDLFGECWEPHYIEAGVHKLKLNTFKMRPRTGYMEVFQESVFGPKEAGRVVPPVYSQFGLDLILVTEVIPAKTTTFEEAEAELREALFLVPVYESSRDAVFEEWYAPFAKKRSISVYPKRIPESAPLLGTAPMPPSGATK